MSRKKLKARDKRVLKNSRDGAIEQNLTTGEDERVSKREGELDLRGGKGERYTFELDLRGGARERDTFYHDDRRSGVDAKKKQSRRRIAEHAAKSDVAADTGVQAQAVVVAADAPRLTDVSPVETAEREDVRQEQPIQPTDAASGNSRHIPPQKPKFRSKPPPIAAESQPIVGTPQGSAPIQDAPQSALKHDGDSSLRFERGANVPTAPASGKSKRQQRQFQAANPPSEEQPGTANGESPRSERVSDTGESPIKSEPPQSPLKHETSDKLRFEPTDAAVPPIAPVKRTPSAEFAAKPKSSDNPALDDMMPRTVQPDPQPQTTPSVDGDTPPAAPDSRAAEPLRQGRADAPLHTDKTTEPLQTDKPGKLKFTEDEAAPKVPSRGEVKQQKRYGKAQASADKSVKKLETAKSKLPTKKKLRSKTVVSEQSGKVKRKLYFENEVKPQSERLKGSMPLRPIKAAGNMTIAHVHRKLYQVEQENVATEAAHKGEMAAEGYVRSALRHHKTAPYEKVAKLERKAAKKTVNAAYQKALADNPKLKGNPIAKAFQKRKIKKDYAKAAREAKKAAERAKKAGGMVADAGKALAGVVKRHPVATAVVVLILLLLFCLMSLIGAFGGMGSGGLGGILTASYLAEDADIDNAELAYTEWETDLQTRIANTESTHSGYDEYRYNVGEISHNPYELMAYLTVKYQNFTFAAVQSELATLFNEQYTLTFTPSTETRYADPNDTNEDGDYEPYDWRVMTVTLTARSFSDVTLSHLSGDDYAHYALLLQTKGARQYLANPFGDMNWLPYVSSYYGYRIHPISGEKNYHKGVDIALPQGTPIQSGQDGTVTFAGYSGDYGNVVVIENDKGLVSKYAHCDTISVSVGQTVKIGDVIATVGTTGNSTGPHLHLEILKNGQYLNPAYFCDSGSFSLSPTYGYAGSPMGDGTYAALIAEAERYLGFPYVWGGSSPSTSFDCSGYVSWVLVHSGVKNVGRLGATGLYNVCTPVSPAEARPGDLIFFQGTYSTPNPVTHVGIYVGADPATGRPRMLHCGNPIQYSYIDTTYWQNHFFAFGRVS